MKKSDNFFFKSNEKHACVVQDTLYKKISIKIKVKVNYCFWILLQNVYTTESSQLNELCKTHQKSIITITNCISTCVV